MGNRPIDVDRYVGSRIRERRIMLGLTQEQFAALIGVTYQQAHKYEKGVNRVSAGRLYHMAQALGCGVEHFFDGYGSGIAQLPLNKSQRLLLELSGCVISMPRPHQEAMLTVARTLAADGKEGA